MRFSGASPSSPARHENISRVELSVVPLATLILAGAAALATAIVLLQRYGQGITVDAAGIVLAISWGRLSCGQLDARPAGAVAAAPPFCPSECYSDHGGRLTPVWKARALPSTEACNASLSRTCGSAFSQRPKTASCLGTRTLLAFQVSRVTVQWLLGGDAASYDSDS